MIDLPQIRRSYRGEVSWNMAAASSSVIEVTSLSFQP
jgi:hypothetical protein